ncbi:MAG: hypothetical protein ABSH29_21555 [Acidimicrobiales bacterium]|jgi:hypothetical protein
MEESGGKYRWRTRIRMHLPWLLVNLAPKGKSDCGNHEWYKSSDELDRCYHCVVGERRPSQIPTPSMDLFEKYGIPRPEEQPEPGD